MITFLLLSGDFKTEERWSSWWRGGYLKFWQSCSPWRKSNCSKRSR